jgi:hypothetical protein
VPAAKASKAKAAAHDGHKAAPTAAKAKSGGAKKDKPATAPTGKGAAGRPRGVK